MLNLTPLLRLYQRYRYSQLQTQDPIQAQEAELLKLVNTAKSTRFGQAHEFSKINSVEDFQKQVPIRNYEQHWEEYWKSSFPRIDNSSWPGVTPYFPVSSGTSSGTTKYIPYSREMEQSNKKAGLDLLCHHLANRPDSRIFAGKSFILGGSTDLVEQAPGIYSGDLSGIAVATLPWWARIRYFPPAELALMKNWEEKIRVLAEQSLKEPITMISGVPNWMVLLFGKLFELRPEAEGRLGKIFPGLEMIVHGGVNFAPYLQQFNQLIEGSRAELREVYPASEGFVAVADRGYGEGLRLNVDHGLFFEFVPLEELSSSNPRRFWIKNVEKDVHYALILSSCAGLWSYILGDTIRFIETKPPRVLITGRTSYYLSAFGEHLIAEEVELGLSAASHSVELSINDYSVGAIFPQKSGELGGHLYVIEFANGTAPDSQKQQTFLKTLDQKLCKLNEDYEAHRIGDTGMLAPQMRVVPEGTFTAWMKSRGKLGGQHKVPRIISDPELFKNLRSFVEQLQ